MNGNNFKSMSPDFDSSRLVRSPSKTLMAISEFWQIFNLVITMSNISITQTETIISFYHANHKSSSDSGYSCSKVITERGGDYS